MRHIGGRIPAEIDKHGGLSSLTHRHNHQPVERYISPAVKSVRPLNRQSFTSQHMTKALSRHSDPENKICVRVTSPGQDVITHCSDVFRGRFSTLQWSSKLGATNQSRHVCFSAAVWTNTKTIATDDSSGRMELYQQTPTTGRSRVAQLLVSQIARPDSTSFSAMAENVDVPADLCTTKYPESRTDKSQWRGFETRLDILQHP